MIAVFWLLLTVCLCYEIFILTRQMGQNGIKVPAGQFLNE